MHAVLPRRVVEETTLFSPGMNQEQGPSLHRGIYKWELVLLFINSVIGAGIFGLPSKIFALSGVYSLLAFVACAVVMLIFILCFAEVGSQFDKTGGPYVYVLAAFGRLPAFVTGWLLILSRIFNYATLVNLLVVYASYFNEAFNEPVVRGVSIVLVTLLLGSINHVGLKNATWTGTVLTIAKLLPLTIFIVIGLFAIEPSLLSTTNAIEPSSFTTSVLLLVFAFGGFETMLINSGEIHQPHKTLPFALIVSCLVIALYYCLIQFVCMGTLPELAATEKPLADAARKFMGPWGGSLIAGGAVVSIIGTLNVLLLSGSRMPFALSMEKQLPPLLAYVHPRYRTPTFSLILLSLAILLVSLLWSFFTALAIASIIRVLVYLLICGSLLKLRRQKVAQQRSFFKVRYGRFLALAGIGISCWLLTASKPKDVLAVAVSILIGLALYFLFRKEKGKHLG